jgi:hypothetical protein
MRWLVATLPIEFEPPQELVVLTANRLVRELGFEEVVEKSLWRRIVEFFDSLLEEPALAFRWRQVEGKPVLLVSLIGAT